MGCFTNYFPRCKFLKVVVQNFAINKGVVDVNFVSVSSTRGEVGCSIGVSGAERNLSVFFKSTLDIGKV